MKQAIKMLIRILLFAFGLYLILAAIGGFSLHRLEQENPEIPALNPFSTYVIFMLVGIILVIGSALWWYKDFFRRK